jgi:signal transduction histidine kinase
MVAMSKRSQLISVLIVWLVASVASATPLSLGFLDFGVYQLPGFLLLRYVNAVRICAVGWALLVLIGVSTTVPHGFWIEAAAFSLLLLSLDTFAARGQAEERLYTGFSTVLIFCFPLYSWALSLSRDEGLLYTAAHAASFVIPTVFCLVLTEVLWAVGRLVSNGFFQKYARPEESERPSIRSLGTVFTCVLIALAFSIFFAIWSVRWGSVLTDTTRDLVDQYGQNLLVSNRHEVALSARNAYSRYRDTSPPWMTTDERFVFVRLDSSGSDGTLMDPRLLDESEPVEIQKFLIAINKQLSKFYYRAAMGAEFARMSSPLYLEVEGEQYPIHSLAFENNVLFVVDTASETHFSELQSDMPEIEARIVDLADLESLRQSSSARTIIDDHWMGGVLWNDENPRPVLSRLAGITPTTRLSLPVSDRITQDYELELPASKTILVDLYVWPKLQVFLRATVTMSLFLATALLITSWLTMVLVGRLIKPISLLLEGFEDIKFRHANLAASQGSVEPLTITTSAVSFELNELQETIVWFSEEVASADKQLRSAITGYHRLLSSLPLGVMEIDEGYQLLFRNEAMSEVTGDSAEASYRLRQRAEQLFESGQTLDEYTLHLDDQPPRHLLLAVSIRENNPGQKSGFWLLTTDLTRQKETDAQLLQTAKLATLGEMSTGMAHELNQPLNIIKLALSNLSNSVSKGRATEASIMERLSRMDSAVDRAATIIDHMRAFGRVAADDFAPFNILSSIRSASDLVREPMTAKGVILEDQVETPVWVVGNAIQFEQVLINMINNARDAILTTASSGVITLRQSIDQEHVTVMIEDTGGGIPLDVLPHVFEPFYTTKPVGKGTGLGGSISYGIIQDMQGSIWAENTQKGAQISIRLPLSDGAHDTRVEEE